MSLQQTAAIESILTQSVKVIKDEIKNSNYKMRCPPGLDGLHMSKLKTLLLLDKFSDTIFSMQVKISLL